MDSPFHKLDPRVRLLVTIELFVLALLSISVFEALGVITTVLVLAGVARSIKRVGRTLVFAVGFAVFIFALNVFFRIAVLVALLYAVRFIAIIGSTSLFFLTTSPDELEQIMKWMRVPRDVVFAFVTAVRFIPVVMLDAFQIMDAQRSRGLEFDKGNVLTRARNTVPILVPLVVNSVIRSGELAEAMESRAYGSTPRPTSLYAMRMTGNDSLVALSSLVLLVVATLYIYHVGVKV